MMKLGNVLFIIFMSILTFIGLALTKLYDTYIKNNILVQGCIYIFCALITIRGLLWVGKPLLKSLHITTFLKNAHIEMNITSLSDIVLFALFVVMLLVATVYFKSYWKKEE